MNFLKRFTSLTIALLFIAAPFVVWLQWQALYDWWRLRGYNPPTAISVLADQDTMTAYGRHLFYINHPQLLTGVNDFRTDCPESEQTIVLGCYHPNEDGIYVYSVQDAQLHGVQQVTAAHEMLHAAYDRLGAKDRNHVDGLLNDFYTNDEHDQRIIDEINLYKKTEPNSVTNEMHSVFGTEVANLPTALEAYYQKYFTNRSAVTTFADGYQGEFTSRLNQINADDNQLASLKTQINAEEQSLGGQLSQINTDRARLDSLRNSGQTDAYNNAVASFNGEVDSYNSSINKLQSDIAAYNDLVNARNAVAGELRSLDNAIDTRLTTQSAQ
jgi:hypothetical protein